MLFTVDIETIPGPTPPAPSTIKAPANYIDPAKIAAYQKKSVEPEWRKQSLNPLKGRVCCIGWKCDDGVAQANVNEDERHLISRLDAMIQQTIKSKWDIQWIGHNAKGFDLVWLKLRAQKYGFSRLADSIQLDRYKGNVLDTMEMVGTWKDYYSLSDLCEFFGIEGKLDGMDGSKVFEAWQAGEYDKIADYCKQDVEMTYQLYQRIAPGGFNASKISLMDGAA